jgi:4-diphosphocytidyl-2-C-methyl-D-erythritol kinase
VRTRSSSSPVRGVPGVSYRGNSLFLAAPAKINWFLQILGKREDGYHNIKSCMQCVSLYDGLAFEHADSIAVESRLDIPVCDNIVYRAASLLKEYASYRQGARILLRKNVPVGGGLGGGSSDAAYTLLGLNMLWGLGMDDLELRSISAQLGSDVPFFLGGPAAVVEGRGEKIEPLEVRSSVALLLVKPRISVSTAWAYSGFDHSGNVTLTKKPIDIKLFCRALNSLDFTSLGFMLYNDLENVVTSKYPVVREIKQRLSEKGAAISAMSGSGSVVFGVFPCRGEAEKVAQEMKPNFCRVVETLTTVSGKQ